MSTASVLIVDDDRSFVEALALFLGKHGFHTYKAYSGNEGLELLLSTHTDVAVIDVHMPDTPGINVAQAAIRKEDSPVVIMISGDDSAETVQRCTSAGAITFMAKPLEPRALLDIISHCASDKA